MSLQSHHLWFHWQSFADLWTQQMSSWMASPFCTHFAFPKLDPHSDFGPFQIVEATTGCIPSVVSWIVIQCCPLRYRRRLSTEGSRKQSSPLRWLLRTCGHTRDLSLSHHVKRDYQSPTHWSTLSVFPLWLTLWSLFVSHPNSIPLIPQSTRPPSFHFALLISSQDMSSSSTLPCCWFHPFHHFHHLLDLPLALLEGSQRQHFRLLPQCRNYLEERA